MSDELKLKPCPFCGGEMTVSGSSRLRRFTISHKNLRNCYFYSFEIDWQTVGSLAEAIEAWNRRVSENAPTAQPNTPTDTPTDTISRQAAIDNLLSINEVVPKNKLIDKNDAVKMLVRLPSAQPGRCEDCRNFNKARLLITQPERKKAKWVHGKEIAREYLAGRITYIEYKDYHCSECGYTVENIRWNVDGELVDRYCTACGAQMEVKK